MSKTDERGDTVRKAVHLILILVLVISLCACNMSSDTSQQPVPQTDPETQETSDTGRNGDLTASETTTEPPIYVYENAMEDFLLPLEGFSWERQYPPEFVMIHFCSAILVDPEDPYNIETIRQTFLDNEVSIHYIIERDGTVRCYIPEDRVAWHAGKGEFGGDSRLTNAMNHYAIGIELAAMGSEKDMAGYMVADYYRSLDDTWKGYTEPQYEALQALVADLCQRYSIPMDRQHIIGHDEYSQYKTDPGELFDWSRIVPEG